MMKMYSEYSKIIDFEHLTDPTDTWELQDMIGEGTYGEVYSVRHKETGRIAAVKIMESIHEVVEEIEEEFQILKDLSLHANIPDFYGLYLKKEPRIEDQVWLVMELCQGGSVTDLTKDILRRGSRLEEPLIAHIVKETLKALHHLHKNHVVHRDIKGHNILLTSSASIKLVDFGVSGHLESTLATRRTSVGTPFWMAPEVIACEQQLDYSYDVRCDIWSLGITAIELADGEPPLADQHPMRALFKIPRNSNSFLQHMSALRNPPPSVKQPNLWSSSIKGFISCCVIKDYEQRPFTLELFNHPFIKNVPDDVTVIKVKLKDLMAKMERIIHEPDVTTKHGRLKSKRKSRRDPSLMNDDLATLEVLDEESIVNHLSTRYKEGLIYTYIGDILLAVNPFTPLTIYNDEHSRRYCDAAKGDNEPHIFAIADQAYQFMMHNKQNQCIVISGESGAGKTESANYVVQQLTQLGRAQNRTLEEKILQVNPLMEAFGNARTMINDNSSRFGKYLEMSFTYYGKVVGAKITEYLLEKSRVINQANGEQNFHIFYYILDGLSSENGQNYHLKETKTYKYILEYTSKSADIATLSVNRVRFKAIRHCFEIIGFTTDEVSAIYSIIAGILHIGNIDFTELETSHGIVSCKVPNMKLIDTVSELLGVDAKELLDALTTTGILARGEVIIRSNSINEALDSRDAMAKALYGRLFSWIVNKINVLLKPQKTEEDEENLIIGLLDIFGFENFQKNSFEQLCINIANEQIQYYFNQHIFAWELQEYELEEIEGTDIKFIDNRPVLDMFLMKPMGLLSLLDEESHFPKATDQTLTDKFHQNIKCPKYLRPKADNLTFGIEHYAGKVEYDVTGFLEKNRDRLPVEVVNLLRMSEKTVVRSLFQTPLTKTGNLASLGSSRTSSTRSSTLGSPAGGTINAMSYSQLQAHNVGLGGGRLGSGSASMTRIQQTVSTYFRFSLMDLLSKMVAGTPHFIRCIKPNNDKIPGNFEPELVTTQLRYTGVLETTRIRRQGYSHRILFSDFIKRYSMIEFGWTVKSQTSNRESCRELLEKLGICNWALGKSKVFLKYYHIEELARRFEELNRKVILIQSVVRMWLMRNRFYKLKWAREKSAVMIQKVFRGHMKRKSYRSAIELRKAAVVLIQKFVRGFIARKRIKPMIKERRVAVIKLQANFRGYQQRKKMRKRRKTKEEFSATVIQRAFRQYRVMRAAKDLRKARKDEDVKAAIIIQTYFRMWRCKTFYQQLLFYKAQKELQLIYFGQQIQLYNKDTHKWLYDTNFIVPSMASADAKTEAVSMVSADPDVSEKRLEQMKKMKEEKMPMSSEDMSYYNKVTGTEQEPMSEKAKICQNLPPPPPTQGIVPLTPSQESPPLPSPPTPDEFPSPPQTEANKKGVFKTVLDVNGSSYYDTIVNNNNNNSTPGHSEPVKMPPNVPAWSEVMAQIRTTMEGQWRKAVSNKQENSNYKLEVIEEVSRSLVANSIARALIANKPYGAKDPQAKETSSGIPWDAPLEKARAQAMTPTSQNRSKKKKMVSKMDSFCQTDGYHTRLHLVPVGRDGCCDRNNSIVEEDTGEVHYLCSPEKRKPQSPPIHHIEIEDDPKTERAEFFLETDKHELANRLANQCAKSVVSLWFNYGVPQGEVFTDDESEYGDDDGDEEDQQEGQAEESDVIQTRPQYLDNKNENLKAPHIDNRRIVETDANENAIDCLKGSVTRTPVIIPDQVKSYRKEFSGNNNNEDDEPQFNFRAHLKKTNIDLSQKFNKDGVQPQQQDFRHVLKRKMNEDEKQ